MIDNIWDLLAQAGLPDPRKNEEFRQFLLDKLNNINEEEGKESEAGANPLEIDFDALTLSDKISYIKFAHQNIEQNPSRVEKMAYTNKLIDLHLKNINLKKILTSSEEELKELNTIPILK